MSYSNTTYKAASLGLRHRHDQSGLRRVPPLKSATSTEATQPPKVNFLFVVNEMGIAQDVTLGEDEWENPVPPKLRAEYGPEKAEKVFRFRDGSVQPAPEDQSGKYCCMWINSDGISCEHISKDK